MCDDDALTAFRRNHNGCLRAPAREGATYKWRALLLRLARSSRGGGCSFPLLGAGGAEVFVCLRSGASSLFGPFFGAGILALFASLFVAAALEAALRVGTAALARPVTQKPRGKLARDRVTVG
ncbi:hypothetical protein MTO96_010765 [Rhipicephalus appendiculatus]